MVWFGVFCLFVRIVVCLGLMFFFFFPENTSVIILKVRFVLLFYTI